MDSRVFWNSGRFWPTQRTLYSTADFIHKKQAPVQTLSNASWEEEQNFKHSSMKRLRYL